MSSEFEQQLREQLPLAADDSGVAHEPDFEALTALMDGDLSTTERDVLLAHLADCEQCRELAHELGMATGSNSTTYRQPRSRMNWLGLWPMPALAMAAVVAVVSISLLISQPPPQPITSDWPVLDFSTWDQAPQMHYRSASEVGGAIALSPRRSLIPTVRPHLRWTGLPDQADRLELMVVDSQQQLVARWSVADNATDSQWPDDQEPLVANSDYAWKLSYWTATGPRTTAFIPFKTMAAEAMAEAEENSSLDEWFRQGRFDQAWLQLEAATELSPDLRHELRSALQQRLQFAEAEAELWQQP
ncbi:MAG: hypothetical protein Tsb002_14920 [Wenzhouxiangellaceae bacterium]